MARRVFAIWTHAMHARFQRALNSPEFRAKLINQMQISDGTVKNWQSQFDVPATKRAEVKALVDAWESETAVQPLIG